MQFAKPKQTNTLIFRNDITGLRGISVICVVINHINPNLLPLGFLGVDIFFAISGYVITQSIFSKNPVKLLPFLKDFYAKRVSRILPTLLFFILATSTVILLFYPFLYKTLTTAQYSLFGLSNIQLANAKSDYFGASALTNPFTNTWSLGIEEQFYFIFPVLLYFAIRFTKRSSSKLFFFSLFLTLPSFLYYSYFYTSESSPVYYSILARSWELSAGVLAFFLRNQIYTRVQPRKSRFTLIINNALVCSIFFLTTLQFDTDQSTLIRTIILAIVFIILLADNKTSDHRLNVLSLGIFQFLGRISYSIYLWHWPLIVFYNISSIELYNSSLILFTASIAIGHISYHLFEKQKLILFILKSKLSPQFILGAALLSLPVIKTQQIFLNEYISSSHILKWATTNEWRHTISLKGFESSINGERCHGDDSSFLRFHGSVLPSCHTSTSTTNTIYFLGDSHAQTLMAGAHSLLDEYNVAFSTYAGCIFPAPMYGQKNQLCNEFTKNATQYVTQNIKDGDIIIIFNYWSSHLGTLENFDTRHNFYSENEYTPTTFEEKASIFKGSLTKFISLLKRKEVSIFLVGAPFRLNVDSNVIKSKPNTPFDQSGYLDIQQTELSNSFLKQITSIDRRIKFIDTPNILPCCKDPIDFMNKYRDGDHLNDTSVNLLVNHIKRSL